MEYQLDTQKGQVTAKYAPFTRQLILGTCRFPAEEIYLLAEEISRGNRRPTITTAELNRTSCVLNPRSKTVRLGNYEIPYAQIKALIKGVLTEAFQPNEDLTRIQQTLEQKLA